MLTSLLIPIGITATAGASLRVWEGQSVSIHHLNCGELHPPSAWLAEGAGSLFRRGHAVCHCLLIESDDGVILVDTGLSEDQTRSPREALGADVAFLLHPSTSSAVTAKAQVQQHGFDVGDVRHIFMTHLDVDHRGGLADFPNATVHVSRMELTSAEEPRTLMDRRRYQGSWRDALKWEIHDTSTDRWHGFPVLFDEDISVGRLVMVELPGHSPGHSGIAIEHAGDATHAPGTLFHVGDAIQHRNELRRDVATPWGIRGFNTLMQVNRRERLHTRSALQELAAGEVDVICAHDAHMLAEHAAPA